MHRVWSSKWFWRRRLPGFAPWRQKVNARISSPLQPRQAGQKRYFGLLEESESISFDEFVLEVMALHRSGYDFDLEVTYHPREIEWISDGGKRDSWEKFEDCHTEVTKMPAWNEIRLVPSLMLDPDPHR
jgi:hypothetical protein